MSLDNSVMFSVSALDRRFRKRGEKLIEGAGITIGQFRVLSAVHDSGQLYQKDIERACVISRAGASGLVDALVSSGLLLRERVDSDGRLRQLSLTSKGEEKLGEAKALFRQLDNDVEALLGEEDKRNFLSLIDKLMDSFEE